MDDEKIKVHLSLGGILLGVGLGLGMLMAAKLQVEKERAEQQDRKLLEQPRLPLNTRNPKPYRYRRSVR